MENLLLEQGTVLIVALIASLAWLIKNVITLGFDYMSKNLVSKQERNNKILQKETELEIIKLQNDADREKTLEDFKLKRIMDRNSLHDGLKVIHILKQLREKANAASVSIIAFHNGIAKNYKNFSMRFQETRSVENFTKENYQVLPLSSYYEEIQKFETQDYLIFKVGDDLAVRNKIILSENNITTIIIFPILILVTENNNTSDSIMSIMKNNQEYLILGCLLVSLDIKSAKSNVNDIVELMKHDLDQIVNIYEQNNNVLS